MRDGGWYVRKMSALIEREAVRAILVAPGSEVLLMLVRSPAPQSEVFWITPGGGREVGESDEQCLRRELHEELALTAFEVGPMVWKRHVTFDWGSHRISQHELSYIVHVDMFTPHMSDEIEKSSLVDFRWWHVDALNATREPIVPQELGRIVSDYLRGAAPRA